MEGTERQNVEARIKCLRNIQVLLDAAVMEMQQYSAVVARCNTSVAADASGPSSSGSAEASGSTIPSSATANASQSIPPATNANTLKTPSQTGARPKSSGTIPSASPSKTTGSTLGAALQRAAQQKEANNGEIQQKEATNGELQIKEASNGEVKNSEATNGAVESQEAQISEASNNDEEGVVGLKKILEKDVTQEKVVDVEKSEELEKEKPVVRSPEQEEIRRRRLAVFEEHKKRLTHKTS